MADEPKQNILVSRIESNIPGTGSYVLTDDNSIHGLSISGKVITFTKGDGVTSDTITTQDTVTTVTVTGGGNAITDISDSNGALTATKGATFAPAASPALTGTPTAPTAAVGTNTTQIATTAFVKAEIGAQSVFGASGSNHSKGLVPDPGSTAGTAKFLREDGAWEVPPSTEDTWRPQPDWNATTGDAAIKNRPTLATVATSGSYTDLTNTPTLPTVMVASGTNHKGGLVPDPGATAGTGKFLREDATWATVSTTDTKNTAGATDTSSKIYLIGALDQTANPQTYSQDTAYVGTDGKLYSDNKVVLTEHQSLSSYAPLASPALTGTPTAPTAVAGTNTTQIATTAFVKAAVDAMATAVDAMRFKGTLGTGGDVESLPASHKKGDTYKVIKAGTYAGKACEIGDMVVCIADGSAASNDDWSVIQANIDGAVTGPASSVSSNFAAFSGTSGRVVADSGYSASSFAAATHSHGYTPAGTVSTPTFTGTAATIKPTVTATGSFSGTAATISSSYTPSGGISVAESGIVNYTPAGSISVSPSVSVNTTTVNSITAVGSLPSLTMTYTANTKNLAISFSQGSLPTKGSDTTVATGIKSATATGSFTGTGTRLVFTGTAGTATASYTPAGSVSVTPTVTGASYTPAGTISQPSFTGTAGTTN